MCLRRQRESGVMEGGNLFANLDASADAEVFCDLLQIPTVRIERIVSLGQATPPGEWLDQERAEWVILLKGAAALRFADETAPHVMKAGDYVNIPAHAKHRVEWTAKDEPTVWLALHYAA
jgi:cupin 2 domain-containing protein